jgi:hypothetical protein
MVMELVSRRARCIAFAAGLSMAAACGGTAEAAGTRDGLAGPTGGGSAPQSDAAPLRGDDLCGEPTGSVTAALRIDGTQADLRALLVHIRYPERKVRLPGSANDPSVAARITAPNGSALVTPNDMGGEMKVQATDPFVTLGYPPLKIEFDLCNGATVSDADFQCRVEFISDETAAVLQGITCAADVP